MDHYAATKHANMLLAQHLYDKWRGRGPRVFTVTPGMVDTSLWRNFPLWYRAVTYPIRRVALRTPDEAALGVVWAALSVEAEEMEQAHTLEGRGTCTRAMAVGLNRPRRREIENGRIGCANFATH